MKVKFSGIGIVDGSGKLGGDVIARLRSGHYSRTKGAATNPNTTYQQAWRDRLTTFTQLWRTLTPAEIALWNRTQWNIPRDRFLASTVPCSGQRLFIRVNSWRDYAGNPPTTVPVQPVPLSQCGIAPDDVRANNTRFSFFVDPESPPYDYLLWSTPFLSPGIRFIRNRVRLLGLISTGGGGRYDATTEHAARFSAGSVGDYYAILLQPFDGFSGLTGPPVKCDGFAT